MMYDGLSRRRFVGLGLGGGLATLAGGSVLVGCGDDDDSEATATSTTATASEESSGGAMRREGPVVSLPMQLAWVMDMEFAGFYIGLEQGYYNEENIELNMIPGGPNVGREAAVVAGNALVGLSPLEQTSNAVLEGATLKVIGAQYQKNPIGIVSLTEAGINSPADLPGKRVGATPAGTTQLEALMRANDLDPSSVEVFPYSFDPTPIAQGELDAAVAFVISEPFKLQERGFEAQGWTMAEHGYPTYNNVFIVLEETIAEQRDVLVGWMRASARGWQTNSEDLSVAVPLVIDKYGSDLGLSSDSQAYMNEQQESLVNTEDTRSQGLFYLTEEGVSQNIESMAEVDIQIDESLFDRSILDEVYADGPVVA